MIPRTTAIRSNFNNNLTNRRSNNDNRDQDSLQDQLNIVTKGVRDCGLDIIRIKIRSNEFNNSSKKVEAITFDDTYKYLGIDIGHIYNRKNRFVEYINVKLINISKAALKPQQKLYLLKLH